MHYSANAEVDGAIAGRVFWLVLIPDKADCPCGGITEYREVSLGTRCGACFCRDGDEM